jgi:hypothetical protein
VELPGCSSAAYLARRRFCGIPVSGGRTNGDVDDAPMVTDPLLRITLRADKSQLDRTGATRRAGAGALAPAFGLFTPLPPPSSEKR